MSGFPFLSSLAIILTGSLFSSCGGGTSGSKGSETEKEVSIDMEIDREVKAPALFEEYQNVKESEEGDFMSPLKKYKGQTFMVTGTVKSKGSYTDPKNDESGRTLHLEVGSDDMLDDVTINLKNDERQDDIDEGMKVKAAGTYVTNYKGPTIHDAKVKIVEK